MAASGCVFSQSGIKKVGNGRRLVDMAQDLEDVLAGMDIEWERTGDRGFLVVLPGTRKLKTNCHLIVEDDTLRIEAFVVRCPEQDAERLWRLLLRRNAEMYAVSFAIDENGDVYLVGRIPLAGVDTDELDRLLGSVLTYADEVFNTALEIGFAESIRREWRWRLSRGEPTRNLAAFEHLKPDEALVATLRDAVSSVATLFGASAQRRPDVGDGVVSAARQP